MHSCGAALLEQHAPQVTPLQGHPVLSHQWVRCAGCSVHEAVRHPHHQQQAAAQLCLQGVNECAGMVKVVVSPRAACPHHCASPTVMKLL